MIQDISGLSSEANLFSTEAVPDIITSLGDRAEAEFYYDFVDYVNSQKRTKLIMSFSKKSGLLLFFDDVRNLHTKGLDHVLNWVKAKQSAQLQNRLLSIVSHKLSQLA